MANSNFFFSLTQATGIWLRWIKCVRFFFVLFGFWMSWDFEFTDAQKCMYEIQTNRIAWPRKSEYKKTAMLLYLSKNYLECFVMMVAYAHTDTPTQAQINQHSDVNKYNAECDYDWRTHNVKYASAVLVSTIHNHSHRRAHMHTYQSTLCRWESDELFAIYIDIFSMFERSPIFKWVLCACVWCMDWIYFAVILCWRRVSMNYTQSAVAKNISFEGDSAILTIRCDHHRCAFICSAVTAYAIPHTHLTWTADNEHLTIRFASLRRFVLISSSNIPHLDDCVRIDSMAFNVFVVMIIISSSLISRKLKIKRKTKQKHRGKMLFLLLKQLYSFYSNAKETPR